MGMDIGKWLHGFADLESCDAEAAGDHLDHPMEWDFLKNNASRENEGTAIEDNERGGEGRGRKEGK